MTERPDPELSTRPPSEGPPPAPRWVKISAAIAALIVLAVIVRHLLGGGMGGHMPGGQ